MYFDVSYEALGYYKTDLIKAMQEEIAEKSKYNEHLCYDYRVERLILLTDDLKKTKEQYPEIFKYNLEYMTESQAVKLLQKLEKENYDI